MTTELTDVHEEIDADLQALMHPATGGMPGCHVLDVPLGVPVAGPAQTPQEAPQAVSQQMPRWRTGHLVIYGNEAVGATVGARATAQYVAGEAAARAVTVTWAAEHTRRNALAALKATLAYTKHLRHPGARIGGQHVHVICDPALDPWMASPSPAWLDLVARSAANPANRMAFVIVTAGPDSVLARAITEASNRVTEITVPGPAFTGPAGVPQPRAWTATITHRGMTPVRVRMPDPVHRTVTGEA